MARARGAGALWLDLLFPLGVTALLLGLTGMPGLSGVLAALPLAGLALADATKRAVLEEPVVFSDAAMLPLVLRHPGLYLPFAGTGWVLGGAGLAAAVLLALAGAEPVALGAAARGALAALGLGLLVPLWWPPARLRAALAREPFADAARFGPFATLALYRAVARAERPARRAAHPAIVLHPAEPAPHVVLVQMESFWDPRGTLPRAEPDLLPHWDRLAAGAVAQGRLAVPGFGANTMRAEFAALTGIGAAALGLDRFNPYFRFAAPGLRSLAGGLRAAGYATLALHPFDRRFFGRHRVLPALGFQRFDAADAFAGAPRHGAHVADAAVAARILAELRAAPGPALVFAITMQAHGPWPGEDTAGQWLAHLRDADAMLGTLAAAVLDRPLLLCAYGDHLPALPETAGIADRRSAWLLWRSDGSGQGTRRDVGAEEVFHALAATLGGPPWQPPPPDPT